MAKINLVYDTETGQIEGYYSIYDWAAANGYSTNGAYSLFRRGIFGDGSLYLPSTILVNKNVKHERVKRASPFEESISEIVHLRNMGMSYNQIAKRFGMTPVTARRLYLNNKEEATC